MNAWNYRLAHAALDKELQAAIDLDDARDDKMNNRIRLEDMYRRHDRDADGKFRWIGDAVKLPCGHMQDIELDRFMPGMPEYPACVKCLEDFENDEPVAIHEKE